MAGSGKLDKLLAEQKTARERSYREQALRLYPHVCTRCGREFEGKQLKELTVHHRDHNHDNNPPDGSNWELLCVYCHDHEHSKYLHEDAHGSDAAKRKQDHVSTHRPFSGLADLLNKKD